MKNQKQKMFNLFTKFLEKEEMGDLKHNKGSYDNSKKAPWTSPKSPKKYNVDVPHHQCGRCHLLHSDPFADKCRRQCCKAELVPLNHKGNVGLTHIATPQSGKGHPKATGNGGAQPASPPPPSTSSPETTTTIGTLDVALITTPSNEQFRAAKDLTHMGQALKCTPNASGATVMNMEIDDGANATTIASYKAIVATLILDATSEHVKATIKDYENKIKILETPKTIDPPSITKSKMLHIESQITKHHDTATAALRAKLKEIEENMKLLAAQQLQVQQAVQELELQHQAKSQLIKDIYKHPGVPALSNASSHQLRAWLPTWAS